MTAITYPLRHVHLYDLSTELFVLGFHIDSGLLNLFLTYAAIDGFESLIHGIKIIIFWYNSTSFLDLLITQSAMCFHPATTCSYKLSKRGIIDSELYIREKVQLLYKASKKVG